MALSLSTPFRELLPSYIACLKEGAFVTMQLRFGDASAEEIEHDPDGYLAHITNKSPFSYLFERKEYIITEHEMLWLHDGSRFLGTLALRYDGDQNLLQNEVGHIGMAIRPSLLNKGYGVKGIKGIFGQIKERFLKRGITAIRISCHPENRASRRLIEYFGSELVNDSPENRVYELSLLRTQGSPSGT